MHVGGAPEQPAVERHLSDGVQAVADQVAAGGERFAVGGELELAPVAPGLRADPVLVGLRRAQVGVADQSGGQQIGVDAAGDGGRDSGGMDMPAVLAAAPRALRVIEFDDYRGDPFDGIAASLAYLRTQ